MRTRGKIRKDYLIFKGGTSLVECLLLRMDEIYFRRASTLELFIVLIKEAILQ
jgi:hypothetical protein